MTYNMGTHFGTKQWINLDLCGLFCGCMTYALLAFGMFATSRSVIIPWLGYSVHGCFHLVLFNCMSLIGAYCHFKAMTTDPGAVPKDAKPLPDDAQENDYEANDNKTERFKKFCKRCKAFKPSRAHHCSLCGRCIVKMDHHCPWVNNCVGVGNHKLFLQFLFWVFTTCIYSMILVAAKYIMCVYGQGDRVGCNPEVDEHLLVIFLLVESVLFGLFTLCMLGDQMSSILSNQTQIDRLKNIKYKQQCEVNEVFGSPSHVMCASNWIYPVPVEFSASPPTDGGGVSMRSVIMGYVLDEPSGEDELAPLMRAANASFTSSSPLHPDYNPASAKGLKTENSSGSVKGANVSVLNRKRNFRSPHSSGLDSGSQNSEDSYYGGAEESIQEWLPTESGGDHGVDRSPHHSSDEMMSAALGVEMSVLHAVKEGTHENASSDADDSSVPLLSTTSHPSDGNTTSTNVNTTVRKRT